MAAAINIVITNVRTDWGVSPHPPISPVIQASTAHVIPNQGTCRSWATFLTLTCLCGSQVTILLGLASCTFLSSLCLVRVTVTPGPGRKVSELSVGLRNNSPTTSRGKWNWYLQNVPTYKMIPTKTKRFCSSSAAPWVGHEAPSGADHFPREELFWRQGSMFGCWYQ